VNLAAEHCRPDAGKLSEKEASELGAQVPEWSLEDDLLETELEFASFRDAVDFVNQVAEIAEQQNHHPDVYVSYTDVALTLTSHQAGGLTRNDFIMAAKIGRLLA
jgi:4a-hydroxytetrahydrobiopterin dehydratase